MRMVVKETQAAQPVKRLDKLFTRSQTACMSQDAAPQSAPTQPAVAGATADTTPEIVSGVSVTGSVTYSSDLGPPPPAVMPAAHTAASFFFGGEAPKAPEPKPYVPMTAGIALSQYDANGNLVQVQQPDSPAPAVPTPAPAAPTPPSPETSSAPAPTETLPATPAVEDPEESPKKMGPMTKLAEAIHKLAEKANTPAPAEVPVKQDEPAPVDPEIAEREEALAYLAANDPKYRGRPLVEQDRQYRQKLSDYETKWQASNPGKRFDPEDEEHDAFHDQHAPNIPEKVLIKAEAIVAADKRIAQAHADMQRSHIRERVEDSVEKIQQSAAPSLVKALGAETLDKLGESNPLAAAKVEEVVEATGELLAEAARMFTPGAHYTRNAASKTYIEALVQSHEQRLLALPSDQRQAGNLRFATCEQWVNMTPSQRAGHWSFFSDPKFAQQAIIQEQANAIKGTVQRASKWIKAPAAPAPTPAPAPAPAAPPPPVPRPATTNPPAGGAGTTPVPGIATAPSDEKEFWRTNVWNMSP